MTVKAALAAAYTLLSIVVATLLVVAAGFTLVGTVVDLIEGADSREITDAGVFALAQGIPVVALAGSRYHLDKMRGLADQFGQGCEVVPLEPASRLASRLADAMNSAWENADLLRPSLLARAAAQVASGRAAYERVATMVRGQAVA